MTTRTTITFPAVSGATLYTFQSGATKVQSKQPTVHGLLDDGNIVIGWTIPPPTPAPPPVPVPPPSPSDIGTGVSLLAYGGNINTMSRTKTGTYDYCIGDWDGDEATLAACSGIGVIYVDGKGATIPVTNAAQAAATVIAKIKSVGGNCKAVFVDQCDSQTQWDFLKVFGPLVRSAGYQVLANLVQSPYTPASFDQIVASLKGAIDLAMHEFWAESQDGTGFWESVEGPTWYDDIDGWLDQQTGPHAVCAANGIRFCAITYTMRGSDLTDLQSGLYARAVFEIARAQDGDQFIYARSDGADPYDPAYSLDLGVPVDPPGSNPRRFVNGTVAANLTTGVGTITTT